MPLEISPGSGYLAALFPPGNLAVRIRELRCEIARLPGNPAPPPLPCAAPLAWFESDPGLDALRGLAEKAPRVYDRYRTESGFLFLAPSEAAHQAGRPDGLPLPAGEGFPLARIPDGELAPSTLAALPPPPRIAFRTFQAVMLHLSWGRPWNTALAWEPTAAVRYPFRRETRT